MTFTGYRQPPFFDLHDIYRIMTAPLFQFTWYLQDLGSLPLLVYAVFTGSRQPPFSIYMIFTGYQQPPFFNLHGIYRVLTAPLFQFTWYLQDLDSPLFQFTWYLQCYLQDLDSPPFLIYMVFTGSRQPPFFNLHGIYNVVYRILAATLFQFTSYLQDLGRLALINLHVIYMICVLLPYKIYSIFLAIYMFQRQNLHDIYSIF